MMMRCVFQGKTSRTLDTQQDDNYTIRKKSVSTSPQSHSRREDSTHKRSSGMQWWCIAIRRARNQTEEAERDFNMSVIKTWDTTIIRKLNLKQIPTCSFVVIVALHHDDVISKESSFIPESCYWNWYGLCWSGESHHIALKLSVCFWFHKLLQWVDLISFKFKLWYDLICRIHSLDKCRFCHSHCCCCSWWNFKICAIHSSAFKSPTEEPQVFHVRLHVSWRINLHIKWRIQK